MASFSDTTSDSHDSSSPSPRSTNPYEPPIAATEKQRQPVKIKAYGLIPMTRSFYLMLQIVLAVAAVVVLIGIRPVVAVPGHSLGFINDYFVTIILVTLALEGIETAVMLSKFKKAEYERA